jgi:hypothetical protein
VPQTIQRPSPRSQQTTVRPSRVDPTTAKPFTLDQELEAFGTWTSDRVWVPPKDASRAMAETMLQQCSTLSSTSSKWQAVVKAHQSAFTQIRQIDLHRASIRLPQGRFYVSVTEKKDFGKIEETIPACVQTRLDEFLAGPGRRHGVKVYYLKPLCVEVGNELVMTTEADIYAAIEKVQNEVFAQYRKLSLAHRPVQLAKSAVNLSLAAPRSVVNYFINRRQRSLSEFHQRLEFKRRRTALAASRTHQKCRTNGGTFEEMLALTNPLDQTDVINQYSIEEELSAAQRAALLRLAAGTLPWFISLSLTAGYLSTISWSALTLTPPILVCDPAFVAEMPGSNGVLLKIGHFDEVDGITHVEI